MPRYLRTVILTLMALILAGCQTSPTGRKQFILVPDAQMNQLGAASFTQMKEKTPPSSDTKLNLYVDCITQPLLKAGKEKADQWEVRIFDDRSANAFALPGKKIGIHIGMIDLAETPNQLAAVIGHEIGHVQARHGAERVSLAQASQAAQQAAAIIVDGKEYGATALAALGLGAQFGVLLPYSRAHESEADYIGLIMMAKAGFDPEGAIELWQNMAKAGGKKPPEFMSTHPSDQTRIGELSRAMSEAKKHYEQAIDSGRKPDCPKPT